MTSHVDHPDLGPLTWNADAGWWEAERPGPDGPLFIHVSQPGASAAALLGLLRLEAGLREEIARRALAQADGWTLEAGEEGRPPAPPTPAALASRLRLNELGLDSGGGLFAVYDHQDPFAEHTILVGFGPDLSLREVEVAG